MALSRSVGPEGRVQPWKPSSKRERSVQGRGCGGGCVRAKRSGGTSEHLVTPMASAVGDRVKKPSLPCQPCEAGAEARGDRARRVQPPSVQGAEGQSGLRRGRPARVPEGGDGGRASNPHQAPPTTRRAPCHPYSESKETTTGQAGAGTHGRMDTGEGAFST